ncbi:MAG TPA: right-handed parallel beta-helix repeat-containing protein [Ornithinibacter sp.]|nr:right-handed parallel beta-helix repeat-containing protein [Ornithinibacter sp.]
MSQLDPLRPILSPALVALAASAALVAGSSAQAAVPASATAAAPAVASATSTTRAADTAGSLAPGGTSYAVPAGAVVAATNGNDAAKGTLAAPVRTIARALALAPAGGTVVLRAGNYHESVVSTKKVTLQSYPREAVWLQGSQSVSGWVKDGSAWRHDGWTTRFDASVGYSKGDKDGTTPGWQWVNPSYPMAAHPDQVFLSGTQQRQVASRAAVVPGTFYLDESTSRLYLGSDPAGRSVLATDLAQALRVRAEGTVIRGIGVRHYAPSIWNIGAVTIDAPKVRLENVTIQDTSTIGLGVVRSDVVLDRVSVLRAGLLGVHAATADRLMVSRSRLDGNNSEQFNSAPVSGGIKVGRSRTVTVTNSSVSKNLGQGYWSDVSVYDTRILNSNIVGNRAAGVFLEISARGTVANNIISDNGGDGVKVNNTSTVTIWNNTVVRNGRALNIVQDPRTPANTSYGDDTRYPNDPEMTWLVGPVSVRNNVIGLTKSDTACVLCVEDYSHLRTAAQMGVTSNGNVFNRATTSPSRWLTVWSRGKTNVNPAVYTTIFTHRSGTTQDATSLAYEGFTVVSTNGTLSSTIRAKAGTAAAALPSSIATLVGQPTGARQLGAFGRG